MSQHSDVYRKPKNYNAPQVRAHAVQLVLGGQTVKKTANVTGICERSLREYVKRQRDTCTIYSSEELKKRNLRRYTRPHKRHKIDPMCGALIKCYVDLQPCITLKKLRRKLLVLGYDVSKQGINLYLLSHNISYKVISRVANETTEAARRIF